MATKNIDIVVKAKDEASKTFDNIAQNSASFSEKVKANLTKISVVSTAITWGLVAMWKKFVEAWNVQIEQETKLTTILKQRANATDAQIQKIKDLASAEQNLWIVWDEVQLAWAQQLATFVNQTETIEKLLPAMNNLVAQQKWYNATTWDAINIWNLMWKVLQWQTSALTRVWITFTEAQEQVLKFWNEEERASMLAQVITDNVWEMNKAMAWTFQWRLTQLNNTIWDIWETIWMALMPALQKAIEAIIPVVNKVADWIAKNPELTANILLITTAIAWLTAVVSWLALALPAIWTAITVLSWPIWWIIWAITLVATAWSQNRWGIQEKTQVAVDKIKEIIWPWLDKLQARWQEHWDAIMEGVWKVLWFIADLIGTTIWWIATYIAWTFTTIEAWFKMFSALLSWDFEEVWNIATEWAQDMDEILTASFWDTRQSIKDWVSDMYNWIVDKLNSVVNAVKNIVWQIKDAWNTAKDTVSNFASNAVDKVSSFFWWWKANWWSVSAWTTYLVWERWPELFVPKSAWTIVPNETITNNNGISINMGNVQIRNDSDIQALASEIVRMTKLEKNYWII